MKKTKQQIDNEFGKLSRDQKITALKEAFKKATNGTDRYYVLYLSHGIKKASN